MRVLLIILGLAVALVILVPALAQQPQEQQRAPGDITRPVGASREVAEPGGDLPGDPAIQLVKVADGLVDPINVVSPGDGSGRLFVVERHGVVRIVQDGKLLEEPFLDISEMVLDAFLEQGFYDLEFHPEYRVNGRFYVHFAELLRNGDSMIVEYRVSEDDPNRADSDSARVILQIEQPWANHNGGEIEFGPDGHLYIGSGDGGWEGDPLEAGQDLATLLGKILRIDVDTFENRPYVVPDDNPFAEPPQLVQLFGIPEIEFAQIHPEARPEIWAWGLRNPWKFQFDSKTGDLYIADVGQNHWEEINFQPAESLGGENYGWDFLMGSHCFPVEAEACDEVGVLPVAEYSHQEGNCAVVGLGVYRGDEIADLNGTYLAGDYCSGRIWGLAQSDADGWVFEELLDTALQITGAGEDEAGQMFVVSCSCNYGGPGPTENPPGALWRVVGSDQVPQGAEMAPVGHAEEVERAKTQAQQQAEEQAQQPQQPEATAELGEQIYATVCAQCHGLAGGGSIGPALAGLEKLRETEHLINQILHGGGGMPGFAEQLSDEEIAAVATHERTSWGNDFGEVTVDQVRQVRQQ